MEHSTYIVTTEGNTVKIVPVEVIVKTTSMTNGKITVANYIQELGENSPTKLYHGTIYHSLKSAKKVFNLLKNKEEEKQKLINTYVDKIWWSFYSNPAKTSIYVFRGKVIGLNTDKKYAEVLLIPSYTDSFVVPIDNLFETKDACLDYLKTDNIKE